MLSLIPLCWALLKHRQFLREDAGWYKEWCLCGQVSFFVEEMQLII